MFRRIVIVTSVIISLLIHHKAEAELIYVDLATHHGVPSDTYGGPAGVAGYWNGIDNGTTSNLNDITGATTSVSVTVTSWSDVGSGGSGLDDRGKLFDDYILAWVGHTFTYWSVVFSGLSNGPYGVYLIASDTWYPTGTMLVNSSSVAQIITGFTVKSTTVSDGTLSISGTSLDTNWFGLVGVQIVPIPGAVWLLGSGLIGIVGIRKKLKK